SAHGAWYVRYREKESLPDGSHQTVQRAKLLARLRDFPKKSEIIPLKNEFMEKFNRAATSAEPGIRLWDFVDKISFPAVERRLARSTVKGYRDSWRCHLLDRIGNIRIRDFRTCDGETLMEELDRQHGTKLAHGTYKHIKVTLSAIFTHAKRK